MSFTITKAWLRQFSTKGVAWNADQLATLGIAWPPYKGWVDSVVGRSISDEVKATFEDACRAKKQERQRALDARAPVYFTEPDGNGGWVGRVLSDEERKAGGVFELEARKKPGGGQPTGLSGRNNLCTNNA